MAAETPPQPACPESATPAPPPMGPTTLSVDIGGTGIKMILLDAEGVPLTERLRRLTPKPANPAAVLELLANMIAEKPPFDRASVGFPGVVMQGVVRTAPNLDPELWQGVPLQSQLEALTRRPVRVLNDADLQGYGVIQGRGVELVLTLGTGMGSALFTNGHLVPNLELGHHPFRKQQTYEERISDAELKRIGKERWSRRVHRVLRQLAPIINYDVLHLGGGNASKVKGDLPADVRCFDNVTGMRGGMRLWADMAQPQGG